VAVKKATTRDDIKQAPEPAEDGYTRLVSPDGHVTTVPDGIVGSLIDSGYKRK
jgi:hypothetical protein